MVLGAVGAWFFVKGKSGFGLTRQAEEKAGHLQKIKDFMQDKDKVTNKEIVDMLGVSDATAVRYFNELEKAGFLKQVGKTGHSVFYSKN